MNEAPVESHVADADRSQFHSAGVALFALAQPRHGESTRVIVTDPAPQGTNDLRQPVVGL